MGLRLRRWLSLFVFVVFEGASQLVTGVSGFGGGEEPSWKLRPKPNALLMLVSITDVRTASPRLLGERLGTDAWALYVIGVRVSVDGDPDELSIRSRSNAVVGYLRAVDPGSAYFTIEGPRLNDAKYALFRR